jgi:hypothetical protein
MYSLSRCLQYVAGGVDTDYRNSAKLTEAFHAVYPRSNLAFDHVVVDIPSLVSSVTYLTRDYVGHERDRETVKIVQRQLQGVLLRRVQPRKSLALLFDGSAPLWQIERTRLFPGRHYDSKFYRSCASPMTYLLEEKLRGTAMELQKPPAETIISGPATPGLSEGKMSAYLLDLATRLLRTPTNPPHLCPAVTASDTVCLVGAPELAWLGVGVTPFDNITTVHLEKGEMQCCSLEDTMDWLRLRHLLPPSLTTNSQAAPATAGSGANNNDEVATDSSERAALRQRRAAARTDVVFLYLLTNGHASTGLPQVLSTPFADVLDAYIALEESLHATGTSASEEAEAYKKKKSGGTRHFHSVLFDEEPLTVTHLDRPALRLRVGGLLKLLVRVYRNTVGQTGSVPSSSKPTPHAATLLMLALQTHGLLCAGGVPSPGWSPTADNDSQSTTSKAESSATPATGTALLDRFPKISNEALIQHLSYLLGSHPSSEEVFLSPPCTRSFGLTGAEALVMTATQPDLIHQLMPLYVRGHSLPSCVADEIVQTRSVHEALRKTQQVLGRVIAQAEKEMAAMAADAGTAHSNNNNSSSSPDYVEGKLSPHPALTHLPSHWFVRTPGSSGPPAGWAYYGVHLGIKAEAMNARYSLDAEDTAAPHVVDAGGDAVKE